MKYIKTYEYLYTDKSLEEPKIGDYVICENPFPYPGDEIYTQVKSKVGILVKKEKTQMDDISMGKLLYYVKYDDILDEIYFYRDEIKYFSNSREELEAILAAKRYNL